MENFALKKSSLPLIISDPAAIAAGEAAKARIQSAYIMAYQKPRDPMESRDKILKACRRSEFAGKAEYSKPVGGRAIRGPSVRFAELALREWGNIMTEVTTLYEDDNLRRVRVSALDLETNAQFTRDIQIKKTVERRSKKGREDDFISERKNSQGYTVYILRATDEEMHTKESAWVSKVLRNEGLRLIPTDIIEEGMTEARRTVADRATKDPEGEKKRLLDAFSSLGIRPKELQKYIKHSLDTLAPHELVNLRSVYQSIRDGESIWADYIGELGEEKPETLDTSKFDSLIKNKIVPNDGSFDRFLSMTALAQSINVNKLKVSAAADFENFWKAFEVWREKNCPAKTPEPWGKDQWWNMRKGDPDKGTGFLAHCEKNKDTFDEQPKELKGLIIGKFESLYGLEMKKPWDPEPQPEPELKGESDNPETNDFNETAEKEAKIGAIREGYSDVLIKAQMEMAIATAELEDMSLDTLQAVMDKCKELSGDNRNQEEKF